MSDSHSDCVLQYEIFFQNLLDRLLNCYQGIDSGTSPNLVSRTFPDLAIFFKNFKECVPERFLVSEYGIPIVIARRFLEKFLEPYYFFSDDFLVDLLFILHYSRKTEQLDELLPFTRFKGMMIIFVDEKWRMTPSGLHCQIPYFKTMDGDQDLMIGYAKKRCYKDIPFGRPTLLVVQKHRYRRKAIILKEVIRISQ